MAGMDYKRFRLSVPVDDEVVLAWLSQQHNMSASLRAIIKDVVRRRGLSDVFGSTLPDGMSVAPRPVGRPRKADEAKPAPAKATKHVAAVPPASPGIVLDDSAMADFGMGLSLGDFTSGQHGSGMDDIMDMMGKD